MLNYDHLQCDNCSLGLKHDVEMDLLCCQGCKVVYYCNRRCQKKQWPEHGSDCKDPAWRLKNQDIAEANAEAVAYLRKWKRGLKTSIMETTGEPAELWQLRTSCQTLPQENRAEYDRHCKARKGKPILYRRPATPEEQVLRFDAENVFEASKIKKGIVQVEFAPGLGFSDPDIDALTAVDADIRLGVRVFITGDPQHLLDETVAIDITDAGVKKLCQAYPNLEVVKLRSVCKLNYRALPEIILNCANIEAVTLTAKEGSKVYIEEPMVGDFLGLLLDLSYRTKLRYFEFRQRWRDEDRIELRKVEEDWVRVPDEESDEYSDEESDEYGDEELDEYGDTDSDEESYEYYSDEDTYDTGYFHLDHLFFIRR